MPLIVDNKEISFSELDVISQLAVHHPELIGVSDFLRDWYSETRDIIALTSGSTGHPKKIAIPKKAMIKSAEMTANYFQYTSGDLVLNSLPIDFIAGKMMLLRAIVSRLSLIVVRPSSLPLKGLEEKEFAFVPMTPYQLQKTLDTNPKSLEGISKILLGGGPVSATLLERIPTLTPTIYHGYGMTETITHIAVRNLSMKQTAFAPLPGIELSQGPTGGLIIKANHINRPIVTTDLINLLPSGEFIWEGRLDNVINTGGVKVQPEVVEQLIYPFITCDCLIAGEPDGLLGEKVVLVLEANEIPKDLDQILLSNLNKFQRPKAIYLLPEFKRTETLKIQRKPTLEAALDNI